jgi:glutamate 5-kinase
MSDFLANYQNIIIKIGSSLIIDNDDYKFRNQWLETLAEDISQLRKEGKNIILVLSGAVATGCKYLQLNRKNLNVSQMAAIAAYGQTYLINHLQEIFQKSDLKIAQLLITSEDCQDRQRYLNMRQTISKLAKFDIIPIINENDSVTTSEIKFGDNDQLSAQVSQLVSADLLILLSDVAGLYDKNPHIAKDAKLVKNVAKIDAKIHKLAGSSAKKFGSGGMKSKILAAEIATNSGAEVIIASGLIENPLKKIADQENHTLFNACKNAISARENWLTHLKPSGKIHIDAGAAKAVSSGKSLLAVGIVSVAGGFNEGDAVEIISDDKVMARGLVNFSNMELEKIIGKHSNEISEILSYQARNSVIHCDNYILLS